MLEEFLVLRTTKLMKQVCLSCGEEQPLPEPMSQVRQRQRSRQPDSCRRQSLVLLRQQSHLLPFALLIQRPRKSCRYYQNRRLHPAAQCLRLGVALAATAAVAVAVATDVAFLLSPSLAQYDH